MKMVVGPGHVENMYQKTIKVLTSNSSTDLTKVLSIYALALPLT